MKLNISINKNKITPVVKFMEKHSLLLICYALILISIGSFLFYYFNGLGLAYNDARSHLDIGRRVVEGLKPGMAQLGSVWLPLNHILMIPTIWNDFMWHSGLSGALISMISYVATGVLIYKFLEKIGASIFGRVIGVLIFALNLNVIYLQSTAMTELLLLATMTAGVYELMLWHKTNEVVNLVKAAFWIMLSTLVRYDGWFLFLAACGLVGLQALRTKGLKTAEGAMILFATLGAFGIFLWLLWNQLIFKDALYFALGPYSAHAQQTLLDQAGDLPTKKNIINSIQTYLYALFYNSNTFIALIGFFGAIAFFLDKKLNLSMRLALLALLAPLIFNVIALYFGFSVLFIQGINGDTWFNARYGIMMLPTIAIFSGYLVSRLKSLRWVVIGLILFMIVFQFLSSDAVTIDDATVGSSQKNVTEVSGWLAKNAKDQDGFVLISAASHDAIIFSSGLPMSKFIHEGTGKYWESATTNPEHWARWIIMRTYDDNDSTWKLVSKTPDLEHYDLVDKFPFADIYQLKSEYIPYLNTKPVIGKQK